ncbi:fatty acyl-CoA reductase wat-like [Anoplophora glabripennis]|uniref:fatty acyl-CoA reductase wat-like n=2 Tax=Anoplophora glabripennis TaxID=217634 RepID=UPI000C785758|nr:fatty acyl-CoA reductase wat-like [Anoplophora glabripennis]
MEGSVQFSEIQHFYKNSTVFLTGATGFVGKLVLEKLLRQCHVKHVYLLIREKDGVDAETRCANIFDGTAFDPLRRIDPEFFKKVSLIAGDCEKPDLGLSELDKASLIKEVEFIFHCAANTKLDATLREATNINVRATRDLLNIAKEAENLKRIFKRFVIHWKRVHEDPFDDEA